MKKSFLQALVLFLLLIGGWAFFYFQKISQDPTAANSEEPDPAQAARFEDLVDESEAAAVREEEEERSVQAPAAESGYDLQALPGNPVSACASQLKAATTLAERQAWLRALRRELEAAPPEAVSEWILRYLASSEDIDLEQPFQLGEGGNLRSAPTFRVWLLDVFGQLAPRRAAELAETMFDAKTSADEYVMHLRNFARGSTSNERYQHAVLNSRFGEMLRYEPWTKEPSNGFLEAFDVPVYTGAVEILPDLVGHVVDRQREKLRRASFLALDRLLVDHPEDGLEELAGSMQALSTEPYVRAGAFARADLSDPEQAAMVTHYLTSGAPGREEVAYFFSLVPNNNLILSHNLLSESSTYSPEEVRARFEAALVRLNEWQIDPSLSDDVDIIEKAKQRIRRILGE